LQAFVEDPGEPRYELELAKRTGLKSGTVYPALGRLEKEGWLTSRLEDVDPAQAGRPARRIYTITGLGLERAAESAQRVRATLPALRERLA
jgi:DNA-binding PadR family transcriptional regulator